jgi:phosphoribosylanthranilate isomerase
MTSIKICGLRTINDVDIVNRYYPEYAGFVLAESKRNVSLSQLKIFIEELDDSIAPVGVFVNQSLYYIEQSLVCGLKIVQLHGDENKKYIDRLDELKKNYDFKIWKVVRIGNQPLDTVMKHLDTFDNVDGFLLDKFSDKAYGGLGEKFNWAAYKDIGSKYPVILAGGLNENNVLEGIDHIDPCCVDVSSGVETDDSKDGGKIKRFIELVRSKG